MLSRRQLKSWASAVQLSRYHWRRLVSGADPVVYKPTLGEAEDRSIVWGKYKGWDRMLQLYCAIDSIDQSSATVQSDCIAIGL